jgi:nuclear pore complex protein Nup155
VVEWCLVVTTKEEAMICALARASATTKGTTDISSNGSRSNGTSSSSSSSSSSPWTVVLTKFIIPSDWISFLSVTSTKSGRVFLGGQDGNVYELDYDLLVKRHQQQQDLQQGKSVGECLDRFYDGSDDISSCRDGGAGSSSSSSTECPDVLLDKSLSANQSTAERFFQNGKRVLEIVAGGGVDQQQRKYLQPPRKCRKINHSQNGILRHMLPDFVTKVGSALFSGVGFDASTTTAGGAITQMVVDDERQVLYTLSSPKGWICAMDLSSAAANVANNNNTESPAPVLAAVLDAPATARLYLEAVSRGRINPPQVSGSNQGILQFLGNGDAAQAGVGGMDGARRILKLVEQAKMRSNSRGRGSNKGGVGPDLLTPVSIRIVPNQESTRITLVAVTSGGIRYYLSTLNPKTMGVGPSTAHARFPRRYNPWKPYSRFTLCHVKAPPPVIADDYYYQNGSNGSSSNNSIRGGSAAASSSTPNFPPSGVAPTVSRSLRVDASCYLHGTFLVAFQPMGSVETGGTGTSTSAPSFATRNDVLIATTPDSAKRITVKQIREDNNTIETSRFSPGGICEIVSRHLSQSDGISGGRVWDIEPAAYARGKALYLALHSKTPTDPELGVGMVPAYVPKSSSNHTRSKALTSSSSSKNTTGTIVPTSKQYFSSAGLTVFTNMLLGRHAEYGLTVQKPLIQTLERIPSYRISLHSGSDGFSFTATDMAPQMKSSSVSRSPRLSPWLLRPDVAPLDPLALQHLERHESTFLALNSGGIHSYQSTSLLGKLSEIILAAGMNVRTDLKVTSFFENYGYDEGCAMCLMLAIQPGASHDLKEWAIRAALSRAYRPRLTPIVNNPQISIQQPQSSKDETWIPNGYNMECSALCKGLYLSVARLLRPIWYKPAVVVTEGRVVMRGSKSTTTPTKVELLLDDDILQEINQPLKALEEVIAAVFKIPIESVPLKGVNNNSGVLTVAEAEELARNIEERNIHSVYRLLSRTTQLLNLLSCLRRAHSMPDLPEVEWGLLHGIQIAQLVETSQGQERIENVLNKLVTSGSDRDMTMTSADANNLANILSQQCYHYFSPGNRYSYLGFQMAKEALSLPRGQSRRAVVGKQAATCLKDAAKNWFSPNLITGRLLHTRESEGFIQVAERAIQYNSPLARAVAFLVELEDIEGLVDVCLITAMNFKVKGGNNGKNQVDDAGTSYQWESGLYHKKPETLSGGTSNGSNGKTMVSGANVTSPDAIDTCYSLIFYYMSKFLNSFDDREKYMGDKLVSVCAFEHSDKVFLHSFFEHMLNNNHKDVLLRVTSSDLEKWLSEKRVDQRDLLLNYYQIQEKNFEAGQIALRTAQDESQELKLNDRIEYLEVCIVAFSSALENSPMNHGAILSHKSNAEGVLNLAKLQARILNSIDSTIYIIEDNDMKRLEYALLISSDLYNHFAVPYDMYEICLLLFHASGYTNQDEVKKAWKNLLCAEIFPCSTRNNDVFQGLENFREGSSMENQGAVLLDSSSSGEDPIFENGVWIAKVEETVVRLGNQIFCHDSNGHFPVDFVGGCLEELRRTIALADASNDKSPNQDWTFSILLTVGVPFRPSFDTLYRIMEDENRGTNDSSKCLSNLEALVSMLQSFVNGVRNGRLGYHNANRLDLTSAVERVKMQLQALPENVTEVLDRIVAVEQDIQRITR